MAAFASVLGDVLSCRAARRWAELDTVLDQRNSLSSRKIFHMQINALKLRGSVMLPKVVLTWLDYTRQVDDSHSWAAHVSIVARAPRAKWIVEVHAASCTLEQSTSSIHHPLSPRSTGDKKIRSTPSVAKSERCRRLQTDIFVAPICGLGVPLNSRSRRTLQPYTFPIDRFVDPLLLKCHRSRFPALPSRTASTMPTNHDR